MKVKVKKPQNSSKWLADCVYVWHNLEDVGIFKLLYKSEKEDGLKREKVKHRLLLNKNSFSISKDKRGTDDAEEKHLLSKARLSMSNHEVTTQYAY